MKYLYLLGGLLLGAIQHATAQTTAAAFYNVVQQKCVSCHAAGNAQGGLDLSGTQAQVYAALVNKTPNNAAAAARGDKLIYPGRPDRSYLFRKINNGFEPNAPTLDANEGQSMPTYGGGVGFSVEEKELLRQWVNFGAPNTGTVVSQQMISDYYNVNGKPSFPQGPPPAPPVGQGFQVKIGPFLIAPGGEVEYFQKFELNLPANLEVTRVENIMSNYSHHLITYKYNTTAAANTIAPGLRTQANYTSTTLQTAVQEATDIRLPQGSAFFWNTGTVIDLNTHYINYSTTQIYLAEAYINVYTSPSGTANQQMNTLLVPNTNISIPANQNPYTFSQNVTYPVGQVYVWGLMGHTHKYGTDYKVYKRNSNGTRGAMIYDAQCQGGVPGCPQPYFDYQHIPLRYFEPFLPLTMASNAGFIHTASYLNTGTTTANWGETSNDEMMVIIAMYLTDTTGVMVGTGSVEPIIQDVNAYPNPAHDWLRIDLPDNLGNVHFALYDINGRRIMDTQTTSSQILLETADLPRGLYVYQLTDEKGRTRAGKVALE
jgi:Secretion system C-terminal sorting domain